ncbi:MAG: phospholipase D-like domain-containing protein [Paracoccaceae bacterium]
MTLRDYYGNTKATGFTVNFFRDVKRNPLMGHLASPFFSYVEPIEHLTAKGCEVRLIVRFSPITTPDALRKAFENSKVRIRYFTGERFHTKLYIVDDTALVGSANLTKSGLEANRELSVVLRQDRDDVFNDLRSSFDNLWNDADVLNEQVLQAYTRAFKAPDRPKDHEAFERYIHDFIDPAKPTSIVVGSDQKSKERTFIQNFRRKYDEILVPAHNEILTVAKQNGFGRPEYTGEDPQIEMGRFLGWLRLTQGGGDGWRETSLLKSTEDRADRIAHYVRVWQSTDDTVKGDSYHAASEIDNIRNIRKYLCDPNELEALNFDEVFQYLTGCHAFYDRLRFVSKELGQDLSGLERLRLSFQKQNTLDEVVKTVKFLLSGSDDAIERAYDCIFGRHKLNGFGEACVMELLGWGDQTRPPFNNRSIRGIRLLGFDVEPLVSGA